MPTHEEQLLQMLKNVGRALNGEAFASDQRRSYEQIPVQRPMNANIFPDKEVGDLLYICYSLDQGIGVEIIIARDEMGHCLTAPYYKERSDDLAQLERSCGVHFACEYHYGTLRELLEEEVKHNLNYHQPIVDYVNEIKEALATGDDAALLPFMDNNYPND